MKKTRTTRHTAPATSSNDSTSEDSQRVNRTPSLADATDLFCNSCATRATARSYRAALSTFLSVCSDYGVTECAEITPSVVAAFPASLAGLAAASTRHHRLSVVKAFLRWAAKAGWCGQACAAVITPGRPVRRTNALTWSEEDCRKLLSAAQTWRDRALLWVLASSGARIGELVHATVGDFDGQTLRLSGKTGSRSVPLGPTACSAIDWYLRHRQPLDPTAPLFAGREGQISERQARDLVYAVCRRARLAPRGPHSLRHAAASRWLRAGIPVVVVAATLGHSRPSITLDLYADALASDLARGLSSDPLWSGDDQPVHHRPDNDDPVLAA
ncbi:MAG: tyrosine-type recombinase/integrase [Candidatus Dormibacteria bacterium]